MSKFLNHEISSIIKVSPKKLIGISFIIGFLFFLLNIFLGVSLSTSKLGDSFKEKLGIYFYIKDNGDTETYKQIISLKENLEKDGLVVNFSSKDDAFNFLQKRVPELVNHFDKFDIQNPLPSTLYVMFKNEKQYEVLKSHILQYKDIILNIKDIDSSKSIKQQENRVLSMINLSNVIAFTSYLIIAILTMIIVAFIWFAIHNVFNNLHNDFVVKKFLGATNNQVTSGFVYVIFGLLIVSFIINFVLLGVGGYFVDIYLKQLFDINLVEYIIANKNYILTVFAIEIVLSFIIIGLSTIGFVYRLNKQVK